MKHRAIILLVIFVIIIGSIVYLEKTNPTTSSKQIDSEIKIEVGKVESKTSNDFKELTEADRKRNEQKAGQYERAKELVAPQGYINTENITTQL